MAILSTPLISAAFDIAETMLAYFGAIIITYGGVRAVISSLRLELKHPAHLSFKEIRGGFASRIILGLDFLIASDILSTIGNPGFNEVLVLGAIVLIRTVLTIILSQETKDIDRQRDEFIHRT
ncbi:DUF1622 domain-containing protein [Methanomassiliicoccus luminyensis]|uniref:DUF1622 domain-containing protein n=1 Tax=Methanomassiliicoccus luminyensis TaxID=1080712 RepID=UPI0003636F43|nr:DUF1622 domain-containing protein [Methanomassiliicoccus luminyensis]